MADETKPGTAAPVPAVPKAPAAPAAPAAKKPEGEGVDRRGALSLALGWAAFVGACAAGAGATVRFMFPNVTFEPPQKFKCGFPSEFGPGVSEKYKSEYGVWICRNEEEIYCLISTCTHLGCTPNWLAGESKFKCPCHGSGFYVTGINFEGPAPRPLERAAIKIDDDGQLLVDKNQKFLYELGQWDDPASYVAARAS